MKKTAHFQKIDDFRDMMNKGRQKVQAKDLTATVYIYETVAGKPAAVAYWGKAKKPTWQYHFKDEAARAERVDQFIRRAGEAAQEKANYQEKKRQAGRGVEVGDVLRASWGYEQTNIDFYKVVKMIGSTMVEIVEIGQMRSYSHQDQGMTVPDPDNVIGKPMRKKARDGAVTVDSVRTAFKMEPEIVAGAKVYNATGWSAYH